MGTSNTVGLHSSILRSFILGALLFAGVNCTMSSNGAAGKSGTGENTSDGGGKGGATAVETAPLGCADIIVCVGECADGDDACLDECEQRGSPEGNAGVAAIVQCVVDHDCRDMTCVNTECEAEIGACLEQSASAATNGRPATSVDPATGALPTNLVGIWQRAGLSDGMRFEFTADGSTTMAALIGVDYGCRSRIEVTADGVSTVDGDALVFHRRAGTQTTMMCDGAPKASELPPADLAYTYSLGQDDYGTPTLTLEMDGSPTLLTKQ